MHLFLQLLLGCLMIGITVMIHAVGLDFIMLRAWKIEIYTQRTFRAIWKPLMAGGIVVSVFMLHVLQMWLWAFLYLALGCKPLLGISDALYFSTTAYATIGFGDITLEPAWQLLSGIEGANGLILFGWTTAFIFEVTSQIYRRERETF